MFGPDNAKALLDTEDFQRILAIPRRRVPTAAELDVLAEQMTKVLRKPSTHCHGVEGPNGLCTVCTQPMKLRPVQAWALYEIGKYGGLFGPIRVGGGKTLLSLLVPFVLDAKRPVLLCPAALREKTETAKRVLSNHWRIGSVMRIISYEELGQESKAGILEFFRPDTIVADEAHLLKNKKAGRTRRVRRYFDKDPRTKKPWAPELRPKGVFISGTMLKGGSIKAFSSPLTWALKEGAPIPLDDNELDELAEAIDETQNFTRPHPGPWLKLASDEDRYLGDDIKTARRAFYRRLVETPGVVSTQGEQVACSLYIKAIHYKVNEATEDNFHRLRGDKSRRYAGWETPDGWQLKMAAEAWAVARQLALGFHSVWDPRPPADWMAARSAWAKFVRETLRYSRTLDTEGQVQSACERGDLERDAYDAWQEIKDEFVPNPKDVWHDTAALETCEAWLKKGPGIVWVNHSFFGDELERRTGVPYFREEGLDKQGNSLDALSNLVRAGKAKPGPIIASAFACSTGFNLQPWNRNLLTSVLSEAGALEQLIGRTHRDGQEADQVEVDVLMGCIENAESWEKAIRQARMAVDVMGDSQKILIADVSIPDADTMSMQPSPRWKKTRQKDE